MIDGFGWFSDEDYRRTLLLFDGLTYVVPSFVDGVNAPPWLWTREDIKAVAPTLEPQQNSALIDTARGDASTPEFRDLVLGHVPPADRQYANRVISFDRVMAPELRRVGDAEGVFAIAYLAEKLLSFSDGAGHLPIVGQAYAAKIMSWLRSRHWTADVGGSGLLTGKQSAVFQPLAAGLSYAFVSSDVLKRAPIADLLRYKNQNRDLLRKHHLQLIAVAQEFAELPDDETMAIRINRLRLEAAQTRDALEEEARDAWLSAGLDLAEKGLVAAASGVATAIALVGTAALTQFPAAALPSLVTGIAIAAGKGVATVGKNIRARRVHASYILNADQYLRERTAS